MKIFQNPFIKRNNDQIQKERIEGIHFIYPMIWCEKYKINVNKDYECINCIFWKMEKCNFKNWIPGKRK